MVSMSKMPNALLNNAGRLASQDDGVVGNMAAGTQYGYVAHVANLDASTPLVLRPMTFVVTNVPGQFKYMPGFPEFTKLFFEELCYNVEGITLQYRNEGHQAHAMADGQSPTVVSDTKRTPVTPTFTTHEYTGNVCWNFIKEWLCANKDPDTQAASLAGIVDSSEYIPPPTYSTFSADLAGIQYDVTMRPQNIIDGIQLTAVHPEDTGDADFRKDLGQSTMPERQFTFHAYLQHNTNTAAAARLLAQTLALHKVNANFAPPIATDIESLIQNQGVQKEAADAISNFTPLGPDASVLSS